MQPTYLPWSGYFNLMAQASVFVLLDDVQFIRKSWQSRNRILAHGAEQLLSVPVSVEHQQTLIQDVRLAEGPWARKHFTAIKEAYGKAAHGPALLDLLSPLYASADSITLLAQWNERLITTLATALAVQTPVVRASALGCDGKRSEHLLAICHALGCNEYLSPVGSADYLAEDQFTAQSAVALRFQSYVPQPYSQRHASAFVSHLSVIDVMAHQGMSFAQNYIRNTAP